MDCRTKGYIILSVFCLIRSSGHGELSEFANELAHSGQDLIEATLHAVELRLRPIVITALAFILGIMPLALSAGAGSSGPPLGTGVVAGMFTASLLGLYFTPLFFVVIS